MRHHSQSHPAPALASPDLDILVEQKKAELDALQGSSAIGGILRTGMGAAAGFVVGTTVTITAVASTAIKGLSAYFHKNRDELKALEKEYSGKAIPGQLKDRIASDMMKEMDHALTHDASLSGSISRNPNSWVAAITVAGGALGYAWHSHRKTHKLQKAEQELEAMERIQANWAERTSAQEKIENTTRAK